MLKWMLSKVLWLGWIQLAKNWVDWWTGLYRIIFRLHGKQRDS
jgi:hypothetical protein